MTLPDEYGEVKITHRPRSAAEIGLRAARIAGGVPPIIPISRAKIIPAISTTGVTRNANARDENVWKFRVLVVNPFKGSAARQPTIPPIVAMITASIMNENAMLP